MYIEQGKGWGGQNDPERRLDAAALLRNKTFCAFACMLTHLPAAYPDGEDIGTGRKPVGEYSCCPPGMMATPEEKEESTFTFSKVISGYLLHTL